LMGAPSRMSVFFGPFGSFGPSFFPCFVSYAPSRTVRYAVFTFLFTVTDAKRIYGEFAKRSKTKKMKKI
jgi:hypothetical protein